MTREIPRVVCRQIIERTLSNKSQSFRVSGEVTVVNPGGRIETLPDTLSYEWSRDDAITTARELNLPFVKVRYSDTQK